MSGGAHQTALLHHLGTTSMTIATLSEEMDLSRRQISDAAAALIRKDYLERIEIGCFRLTKAGRQAAISGETISSGANGAHKSDRKPEANTLRQRAWNVMRIQRRFTVPDLITTATTGDETLAQNNLQRFCSLLCKAGVLRRLPKRQSGSAPTSNGFAQYTLVRDLGHIAPSHRAKAKSLFDHNSGKELPLCRT